MEVDTVADKVANMATDMFKTKCIKPEMFFKKCEISQFLFCLFLHSKHVCQEKTKELLP